MDRGVHDPDCSCIIALLAPFVGGGGSTHDRPVVATRFRVQGDVRELTPANTSATTGQWSDANLPLAGR